MALNKFTDIDEKEITSKGVQALADRPNKASQYGQGGLSAIQLKKWFDNLAYVLRKKINEDHATFASYDATKFVALSEALQKKRNQKFARSYRWYERRHLCERSVESCLNVGW